MKITYIIIIGFFCFVNNSCNTKEITSKIKIDIDKYTVSKIDSINNWYIILANKNDSAFKIISKKNDEKYCNYISIGKTYSFILHSRKKNPLKIGDVEIVPQNYLDIQCFSYDSETEICIEPENNIYELYSCENLKGLCFIEE